jgi:hypothetical protein
MRWPRHLSGHGSVLGEDLLESPELCVHIMTTSLGPLDSISCKDASNTTNERDTKSGYRQCERSRLLDTPRKGAV